MGLTQHEIIMLGALQTIIAQTEPDAIPHRDYERLRKDIYDCASAAISEFTENERVEAMMYSNAT